jgi:hypothetical protein
MSTVRKALCAALLFLGVAGIFAIVFGLTAVAGFRYGLYPGLAVFTLLVGAITFGICALFAGEKIPDEDDGWGEVCAPEGATVVPFRGAGR